MEFCLFCLPVHVSLIRHTYLLSNHQRDSSSHLLTEVTPCLSFWPLACIKTGLQTPGLINSIAPSVQGDSQEIWKILD